MYHLPFPNPSSNTLPIMSELSGDTNSPDATPLRKRILSSSNFKAMLSSKTNSGALTPRNMEKTDSVTNLTRSSLYGIFNENSTLNLAKDYDEVYVTPPVTASSNDEQAVEPPSPFSPPSKVVIKLALIGGFAYLYSVVASHVLLEDEGAPHQSFRLSLLLQHLAQKTQLEGSDGFKYTQQALLYVVQGLLLSSVHPMLDRLLPKNLTKRLLTSNPNHSTNTIVFNDIVRALITFLGILYAIRKIEWTSAIQLAMVWLLMNPGLWLLLDGTVSGAISGILISTVACLVSYLWWLVDFNLVRDEYLATWLYVASHFFCGAIIFGKLGRALW